MTEVVRKTTLPSSRLSVMATPGLTTFEDPDFIAPSQVKPSSAHVPVPLTAEPIRWPMLDIRPGLLFSTAPSAATLRWRLDLWPDEPQVLF